MRRVRKTATKAKAAFCLMVSVHPGSPLAESGLVCRDLLGRSLYYSPLWTCLLQSRNRASLGKPVKSGVWRSAPVRRNIKSDYLLCSCVVRLLALPDFVTRGWQKGAGRRRPCSYSEFVPAVIGRGSSSAAMSLKRTGEFLAERPSGRLHSRCCDRGRPDARL
jgi:hypothetical protein